MKDGKLRVFTVLLDPSHILKSNALAKKHWQPHLHWHPGGVLRNGLSKERKEEIMKFGKYQILLVVSLVFMSSPAMALDPEKVAVAPELAALYADFFPADIFQATDGVYVARGYNRDNPVLIEGTDGLIVIDPGESIPAAETVKSAFNEQLNNIFERKPVKAIIYTHHHDCHIHGASVFAGADTEIIAHENLESTLFYDWFSQVYPSRHVGGAYMSGALFADDSNWYAGCGLFAVQISGDSGYLSPTRTVHDKLETTIAGVKLTLYSAPGETRDVLAIWLPDKKTLVQIANLYQSFPAITTLRGACPRDPLSYIDSIDLYRSLNPGSCHLIIVSFFLQSSSLQGMIRKP